MGRGDGSGGRSTKVTSESAGTTEWRVVKGKDHFLQVFDDENGQSFNFYGRKPNKGGYTPLSVYGWDTSSSRSIYADKAVEASKYLTHSDARIKQEVSDVDTELALANVLKLKAREYGYIPEHSEPRDRRDRGFIAQELARVLPHAVHKTHDHELSNGKKLRDLRAVNHNDVLVELVAAFQALHKEHKEVVARLKRLETSERRRAPRKRS